MERCSGADAEEPRGLSEPAYRTLCHIGFMAERAMRVVRSKPIEEVGFSALKLHELRYGSIGYTLN